MKQYKSIRELKALATMQMQNKFSTLIGAFLINFIVSYFISELSYLLIPTDTTMGNVLNYIVAFIIQILIFVFNTGLYWLYLHAACNIPCKLSDLVYGFKNDTNKLIILSAIMTLIQVICLIPTQMIGRDLNILIAESETAILNNTFTTEMRLTLFNALSRYTLVTSLCLLLNFLITLPLFPVFYIALDYPALNIRAILTKSVSMMKGNKIKYILLQLSFIPMIFLLSIVTCGLALIWIIPYMHMTTTNFYLDISTKNKATE